MLLEIAQELWDFVLQLTIFLSMEYLPGAENIQADWESKHISDSSDWMLDQQAQQPARELYQLEKGPLWTGDGCTSSGLGDGRNLLSSIQSNSQSSVPRYRKTEQLAVMASTSSIPDTVGNVIRHSGA